LTQIFFYHGAADRIAAAAALIAKASSQKKPVLVYAPDDAVASALDRALWIGTPTGFVPHVRSDSPLATETAVVIADRLEAVPQASPSIARHERLMNLSGEIPSTFSRFTSLIEVVSEDPEIRQPARERVRFYKDRGYEVQFFDLAGKS